MQAEEWRSVAMVSISDTVGSLEAQAGHHFNHLVRAYICIYMYSVCSGSTQASIIISVSELCHTHSFALFV